MNEFKKSLHEPNLNENILNEAKQSILKAAINKKKNWNEYEDE